jgi:hypothetical protein
MNGFLGKWGAALAAYVVIKQIASATLTRGAPTIPGDLPASILASAITVGLLSILSGRVAGRGPRRVLTLSALLFVPQANNFTELIIFPLDLRAHLAPLLLLQTATLALATAWVLDRLTPAGPDSLSVWPSRRSNSGWLRRLLACDVAYAAVYIVAGLTVWPFVRPFYESRAMPTPAAVLSMQVLRGFVFVGLLTWLVHELRVRRWVAMLLGGFSLAVFSGVELIVPSPYLPDFARLAHLVEIGVSNVVYGTVVMWALTEGRPRETAPMEPLRSCAEAPENAADEAWRVEGGGR